MLIFDIAKSKSLSFVSQASGIESTSLKITFRMEIANIEYGFIGAFIGDRISVQIPPLREVNPLIKPGIYQCKIEVVGPNNYYAKPFEEQCEVKHEPKIEVSIDTECETNATHPAPAAFTISTVEESEVPIQEVKKSKLGKFFEQKKEEKE